MKDLLKKSLDDYINDSKYFHSLNNRASKKKKNLLYSLFEDFDQNGFLIGLETVTEYWKERLKTVEVKTEDIIGMIKDFKNIKVSYVGEDLSEELMGYSYLDLVCLYGYWAAHPFDVFRALKKFKNSFPDSTDLGVHVYTRDDGVRISVVWSSELRNKAIYDEFGDSL